MRDLMYPEDARKVYNALLRGLEYDAAIAVLGNGVKLLAPLGNQPDFSTGIKFGDKEADEAVRRDAPGLFSRFALLSMITRIEEFNRSLLSQRHVLEELKAPGQKMTPPQIWSILRQVYKKIRENSATEVVTKLIVTKPSAELVEQASWLTSLIKVRNCLAHRRGVVQIDDVKERGTPIEQVKDTDTLKAQWLKVKASVAGKEIKKFPYSVAGQTQLDVHFEVYERSWKIGEIIHITPLECQGMAQSLAILGGKVLSEFEIEMNPLFGIK